MLTGWYPTFKCGRVLARREIESELRADSSVGYSPDDAFGIIRMNSTFVEFVERTFKLKGMAVTAMCSAFTLFEIVIMAFSFHSLYSHPAISLGEKLALSIAMAAVLGGLGAMMWMLLLRKDLFQYTHYPVRFNRVTRKIYFFRHNDAGGVTVVPWGSPYAFFHIGRGAQNRELRDLRCHLLDRNQQIQQTYTVGHFWHHDDHILEQWALICRYMQDGPEGCYDDPLDRVITLSSDPTLRNCWLMVILMMGTALMPLRTNLMFPIYGALALCRWLTFKTCRKPVFPPEIEAECEIDPEDPYRLPEPRFMAEFASDPAIYARALERHKERMMWRPEK